MVWGRPWASASLTSFQVFWGWSSFEQSSRVLQDRLNNGSNAHLASNHPPGWLTFVFFTLWSLYSLAFPENISILVFPDTCTHSCFGNISSYQRLVFTQRVHILHKPFSDLSLPHPPIRITLSLSCLLLHFSWQSTLQFTTFCQVMHTGCVSVSPKWL